MNKERLEELKKMRLLYEVCFVDEYASVIDDVTADFDLLIKRVQELEKEITYYKMATESYFDMEQQNKRYREVLEFYALGRHWITSLKDGRDYVNEYGELAEKALEGEGE